MEAPPAARVSPLDLSGRRTMGLSEQSRTGKDAVRVSGTRHFACFALTDHHSANAPGGLPGEGLSILPETPAALLAACGLHNRRTLRRIGCPPSPTDGSVGHGPANACHHLRGRRLPAPRGGSLHSHRRGARRDGVPLVLGRHLLRLEGVGDDLGHDLLELCGRVDRARPDRGVLSV